MRLKSLALFVIMISLSLGCAAQGAAKKGGAAKAKPAAAKKDAPTANPSDSKFQYPFQNYNLPIEKRVADLVSRMTLDEKISVLHSSADDIPRLGIQRYSYGNEGLHGVLAKGFTVFPQAIALSATWNVDMVSKVSTAISDEAYGAINRGDYGRAKYPGELFHSFWSPTINMARDPRWGRTGETYGEDPFLTGKFAVAFVKGFQGNDPKYIKVVSTPKHFVANNEDHNRDYCNPKISETALREYYFPAFKATVTEGHAQSIMGAYNAVNGVPCNANKWLMVDVLRKDWGFDGYVVTDCGAPHNMYAKHKYAKTPAEAAAFTLNAGVAVECGGDDVLRTNMKEALKQKLITEATIDRAITEAFTVRFRLGLFDPPELIPYTKIPPSVIGSKEHMELAREESRQSIVLLKNAKVNGAPFLPLDPKKMKTVAVVGPSANVLSFGDYTGTPINTPVNPLEGIRNKLGPNVNVIGVPWHAEPGEKAFSPIAAKSIKAEYFNSADFSGAPAASRDESAIALSPSDVPVSKTDGAVSVRWTAKLTPERSGAHYLHFDTTAEARLFVDGKAVYEKLPQKKKRTMKLGGVMDTYYAEEMQEPLKPCMLMLEAGKTYDIKVEYSSPKGITGMKLDWAPPSAGDAAAFADEMKALKDSDAVIAYVGLSLDLERETRDRHDLDIPNDQNEYVKQALALNPNTAVVLINGGPVSINWINDNVPGILEAWYPGEQGGNAIADVLFGDYNPAGRVPVTYYKSVDDLPPFDDYEVSKGRTYMYFQKPVLYPFGYGLSYTTFDYSGLSLDKKTAGGKDVVNVTFNVKNTGSRGGDEVVQVYVGEINPPVKRPIKQLRGFKRVSIAAGETKSVTIPVAIKDMMFWNDKAKKFEIEPGKYEIQVGASSADIKMKDVIEVK